MEETSHKDKKQKLEPYDDAPKTPSGSSDEELLGRKDETATPAQHPSDAATQSDQAEAKKKGRSKSLEASDINKDQDQSGKGTDEGTSKQADKEKAPSSGQQPGTAGGLPENEIEQGRVFFLYRPKVTSAGTEPDVSNLNDIQRLYIILEPQQPAGGKSRLMIVAKKRLPDVQKHERFFAFIEAVADSPSELTAGLTEETHSTKTRGERLQPAARAAGEGSYVIAKGGKRKAVHLGFKLVIPSEVGEAQQVLGIKEEGSFVLQAKNPEHKRRGAPSAGPAPEYTPDQLEQFDGRAWIGVEDPSLLDVAGTELLLVGAKADPIETGELGPAGAQLQDLAKKEDKVVVSKGPEKVLTEALEPNKAGEIPVEPAVEGQLQ